MRSPKEIKDKLKEGIPGDVSGAAALELLSMLDYEDLPTDFRDTLTEAVQDKWRASPSTTDEEIIEDIKEEAVFCLNKLNAGVVEMTVRRIPRLLALTWALGDIEELEKLYGEIHKYQREKKAEVIRDIINKVLDRVQI